MDPLDSLPEALRETVEHALRAVHEHPEHQLLPIYRAAIYDAVGKPDEPQQHMFLATLAALTAKKALPFWTKEVNDEPLPQRLISMAESTLKGDLSEGRAEAAADWALGRSASLFRELDKKTPNGLSVQAEGALLVAIAA